jgi:hypothetical protein
VIVLSAFGHSNTPRDENSRGKVQNVRADSTADSSRAITITSPNTNRRPVPPREAVGTPYGIDRCWVEEPDDEQLRELTFARIDRPWKTLTAPRLYAARSASLPLNHLKARLTKASQRTVDHDAASPSSAFSIDHVRTILITSTIAVSSCTRIADLWCDGCRRSVVSEIPYGIPTECGTQ